LALALGVTACGDSEPTARDQWIVVIGTDAPVPQFGDRLYVEVLDADGNSCLGCERMLAARDPNAWPLSFGIVSTPEAPAALVRAVLFRAIDGGSSGLPESDRMIEAVGSLPPAAGIVEVGMNLSMDCFGVPAPADRSQTCDRGSRLLIPTPTLAHLENSEVLVPGSWAVARTVECADPAPEGMVCIPGGVFLIGDPRSSQLAVDASGLPERLVRLSPYYLDVDELSVGEMKKLVDQGAVAPIAKGPAGSVEEWCLYEPTSRENDAMPVNCVSQLVAIIACEQRGRRLPSEAEWEFAASNRTRESVYPWGDDDNACGYAIIARGHVDVTASSLTCRNYEGANLPAGASAGGHPFDVTDLGVRNLGGNLSEIVADHFVAYRDACWSSTSEPLVDPSCPGDDGDQVSLRGGSWGGARSEAQAFSRNAMPNAIAASMFTGMRCALSATPAP
jgi:formylglycine-generating enzyme required for sulfatase activity